jgi:hypothetical protein
MALRVHPTIELSSRPAGTRAQKATHRRRPDRRTLQLAAPHDEMAISKDLPLHRSRRRFPGRSVRAICCTALLARVEVLCAFCSPTPGQEGAAYPALPTGPQSLAALDRCADTDKDHNPANNDRFPSNLGDPRRPRKRRERGSSLPVHCLVPDTRNHGVTRKTLSCLPR